MYYDIDDKTRFVVIYQDITKSVASIVHYTGIPERTIRYWISELESGKDIYDVEEGRGRKKVLKGHTVQELTEEVKVNPYKASTRSLALEYNTSKTTISSALDESGFHFKTVHAQKELTDDHKRQRVEFCQDMLGDPSQINRIWFSDEMGYNLQSVRKKVWTDEDYFISERPKPQKLNAWAAISVFGKTHLDVFEENFDSNVYLEVLERHYNEMARVSWRLYRFQQDNLSSHYEERVADWFKGKTITTLKWPPNSPDLNPIENCWGWLKEQVRKENPLSLEELKESLDRNWEKLTMDFIRNCIDSLPQRFRLCIESGGERLKY